MAVHVFISSYDARAGGLTIRKHIVFIAWKVSICAENVLAGMSVQHVANSVRP
jgi:hypothetical protein